MQELSLKSGGGRNFGRGRNLGRVRYMIYLRAARRVLASIYLQTGEKYRSLLLSRLLFYFYTS